MIYINKTGTTTIYMSVSKTLNDSYTLFLNDVSYGLTDISNYPNRYNKFIVPQVTNLVGGEYEIFKDSELIGSGVFSLSNEYIPTNITFDDEDMNNKKIFNE